LKGFSENLTEKSKYLLLKYALKSAFAFQAQKTKAPGL